MYIASVYVHIHPHGKHTLLADKHVQCICVCLLHVSVSLSLSLCVCIWLYMYAKATVPYWLVLMWLSMCRGGRAAHKHIHWAALAVESIETSSHRPVWWPQTGCFTVFQYVWHTALIYFNLLHIVIAVHYWLLLYMVLCGRMSEQSERGAASSFARLFREYAGAEGVAVRFDAAMRCKVDEGK